METPAADVGTRATTFARGTDLVWVADLLAERREDLLERWLEVTMTQPFHAGRRERAVADDIPRLFDALVKLLRSGGPPWTDPSPPLEDESITLAARGQSKT